MENEGGSAHTAELTWMDILQFHIDSNGTLDYATLHDVLDTCLNSPDWYRDPDGSRLFELLALCWDHPFLEVKIRTAMKDSFFDADMRNAYVKCIENMSEKATGEKKGKSKKKSNHKEAIGDINFDSINSDSFESLLIRDSSRKISENVNNMSMILTYHSHWEGRFSYDSFLDTVLLDSEPLSNIMERRISKWLGLNYRFGNNSVTNLRTAIYGAAVEKEVDSLSDYINSLPKWDGISRIRRFMAEWCGAKDDEYAAWVGYVAIIQMMARAITPGCIARAVTIFEGPERTGKTRFIKELGKPWAITMDMNLESKESHMMVQGVWCAELAELESMRKTAETKMKSFVTQTTDSYIPKFLNYKVNRPRRTCFFGTTNEDEYLISQTGNTRWNPIKTGLFDIDRLIDERDQLFAEAYTTLSNDPELEWWIEPEELKERIASEREKRRIVNEFEGPLAEWLNKKPQTSWQEIATHFLKLDSPERWKDRSLQMAIASALKAAGYVRIRDKKTSHWVLNENEGEINSDIPF